MPPRIDPPEVGATPSSDRRQPFLLRHGEWMTASALIALLSLPGFVFLKADQGLDWTDLGYWTINARNAVLWGQAFWDNYNLALLAPLQYLLAKCAFLIAGPGFTAARVLGGVKSVALLSVTYLFVRTHYGRKSAVLAVLLLGTNPFLLHMLRAALPEPLSGLLLTCSAFFYFDKRSRKWTAFASGIFSAAAVLAKLSGFVGLLPFLLLWLLDLSRRPFRRRALLTIAGLAAAGIAGASFSLHYPGPLAIMIGVESTRGSGEGYLLGVLSMLSHPQHPAMSPTVLWALFAAGLTCLMLHRFDVVCLHLRTSRPTVFLLAWIAVKTLANPAFSRLQPARRWDDLFIVVAILTAVMLVYVSRSVTGRRETSSAPGYLAVPALAVLLLPAWGRAGTVLGIDPALMFCGALLCCLPAATVLRRMSMQPSCLVSLLGFTAVYGMLVLDDPNNVAPLGVLSLLLAAFALWAVRSSSWVRPVSIGLATISLLSPVYPYLTGKGLPWGPYDTRQGFTYGAYEFAKRCDSLIAEREYVVGEAAFTFCLENRGIPVQFTARRDDARNTNATPFETYRPRWAITCADEAPGKEVFLSSPVDCWGQNVFLYRLNQDDYDAAMRYHRRFTRSPEQ